MNEQELLPGLRSLRPTEMIIYDTVQSCSYLPNRKARLPMRLPLRGLKPEELDQRFSAGDVRHGLFFYRPTCPSCKACEAMRIDVTEFKFSASHRRALRKGDRLLTIEHGTSAASDERIELYERHKRGRQLYNEIPEPMDHSAYSAFIVGHYVRSFEIRYSYEGTLVAVAITDHSESALSAMYCMWDPEYSHLGLGTYSILKQIELARQWNLRHLYLGIYIKKHTHMEYKARFVPHERLIDGQWQRFGSDTVKTK